MKRFISNCVSENGKVSSKRVVTLLAFVLMGVGFIANLFWDYTIDQYIYESMQWVVMVGLGATVTEKFSRYMTDRDAGKAAAQATKIVSQPTENKTVEPIPSDSENV